MKILFLLLLAILSTGCKVECNCNCLDCGIKCKNKCEDNRCIPGDPCCNKCICNKYH